MVRNLSVDTQEEDSQNAGAGMSADDSANITDMDLLDTVLFLDDVSQRLSILGAVAMSDGDQFLVDALLTQLLGDGVDGSLTATGLGAAFQLALVVDAQQGLDVQHGTNQSGGGADTAAALQVEQVVHGDLVAQVQLIVISTL